MSSPVLYVVRSRDADTIIRTCYCYSKKEALRALSCYMAIDSVIEVVVNDYFSLDVLTHYVKKGVKPIWGNGLYGTF